MVDPFPLLVADVLPEVLALNHFGLGDMRRVNLHGNNSSTVITSSLPGDERWQLHVRVADAENRKTALVPGKHRRPMFVFSYTMHPNLVKATYKRS